MKFLLPLSLFLACTICAHDELQYTDRITSYQLHQFVQDSSHNHAESCDCTNIKYIVSDAVTTQIYFNVATVTSIADVPEGASLDFEMCALNENLQWGEWQQANIFEGDLHFSGTNQSYQYRISLKKNTNGEFPVVKEIQISYDYIFPHMLEQINDTPQTSNMRNVSKPHVISRSEWGARSPKSGYSYHTPKKLTIHHTYRPLASSFSGSSTIKQIQNYHMDSNGWSDIGYHFLIGTKASQAYIYQGRPENVLGAHTGGANTNNVGVNLIGDYDVEAINPIGYNAMIHTLAWLCSYYNISPDQIYGHKDFKSTLCPGSALYNKIPQIKKDVRNFLNSFDEQFVATGTLIGAVYESAKGTSARISGATVTLSTGQKTTTSSDGIFKFEVSPGQYNYTISKSGYKSGSSSKYVPANETTWGSVGLNSNGSSPSKSLSGAHWVKQFPPSRSISDLSGSFKDNTSRFYNALKNAGANVYISNTLRPEQRAFLMHWAFRIAKESYNPQQVPAKSGVNIEWWHGSTSASVAAAREMVSAYGIVYRPALSSNHIRGLAIDMTITWSGTLRIKDANGKTVSVGSPNSGNSNRTLWEVGKSYGVHKLASDPPHWSSNGG